MLFLNEEATVLLRGGCHYPRN